MRDGTSSGHHHSADRGHVDCPQRCADKQDSGTVEPGDIHERIAADYQRIFRRDNFGNVEYRTMLLKTVLSRNDHFTAAELEQDLKANNASLNGVSLQDTLASFVRYGLLSELRVDGQPVRYEHFHLHRHHDHAVCVSCGRIDEIEVFRPGWAEQAEEVTGYQILQARLQLHGLCPECRGHRPEVFGVDRAGPGEPLEVEELVGDPFQLDQLISRGIEKGARIQVIHPGDSAHDAVLAVNDLRQAVDVSLLSLIRVREVCRCISRHPGNGVPLTELGIGKAGKITRICGRGPIRHRLLEMGITRGSRVFVERVAPLGDPIGVSIKGYCLAIRKADASRIEVIPCD